MFFNAAMSTDKILLEMDVFCSSCQDYIDFKNTFFITTEKKLFLSLGTEEKKSNVDLYFSLRLCASFLS